MTHKLTFTFIAALTLAAGGCKKKGGADCDKAIDHSMELAKADMQKMGNDDAAIAKMKSIGVQHCKDDKWSAEVTQCMIDSKAEADAQKCYDKLSADQQKKMNDAVMEAMKPAGGATPPPDMGSAAPAGSAAPGGSADMAPASGSAAAGSAAAAPAGSAAGSAK
ncbi:MAG: hypothetical protein JO257_00575 [Deltaproteobacteria bacterium]|nr:hypothetical protein [Deltaproteobacteria bacterium]